jgi:hypothetical protein
VLSGLSILGDTSLELSDTGGDDEDGTIGLGGTGDHVLDEITVTGSVDNGNIVSGSLELPESNVDGDTTFTLSLKFVKNPSVLEGRLSELGSLLLELLDSSLVNSSTLCEQTGSGEIRSCYRTQRRTNLVDQVSGGGGLSRVDVSNDNDAVKGRRRGQEKTRLGTLFQFDSLNVKLFLSHF